MLPKRVVFAANASTTTGAGHLRRLIEIAKALPDSIEKHLIGSIDIPWLKTSSARAFLPPLPIQEYGADDLVVLDSYDREFCFQIQSRFTSSQIVQVADRHTFLLPRVQIVFMDIPFIYKSKSIDNRVIVHGVEYLPIRKFKVINSKFKPRALRVLITSGGVVSERIYQQLARELSNDDYSEINFEFIGLPKIVSNFPDNLRFHPLGDSFDVIAAESDTAISAAGTTMWDLLANQKILGIAAIVENQKSNFDYAVGSNLALPIFDPVTHELNLGNLRALLFNQDTRKLLYGNSFGKYDFLGATRTSEVILNSFSKNYVRAKF